MNFEKVNKGYHFLLRKTHLFYFANAYSLYKSLQTTYLLHFSYLPQHHSGQAKG